MEKKCKGVHESQMKKLNKVSSSFVQKNYLFDKIKNSI